MSNITSQSAARAQPGPRGTNEQAPRTPIPRGDHARERILRAALEVLADHGLGGFNMEAVARRAGASKATVYRRWPSQSKLLVDAMDAGFHPFPLPSTGALRTDLIEILSTFESVVTHGPFSRLMAAFIDAAECDPTLWGLHVQLTEQRREPVRHLLSEAIRRGEISPTTDLEVVVDLLAGPAFYRRFVAHWAFPPGYAAAIVDLVLAAVRTDPDHKQRARNGLIGA